MVSNSLLPEVLDRKHLRIRLEDIDSTDWLGDRTENELNGSDKSIYELFASIEKIGLINPITVRENGEGKYKILAGKRRMKACEMLHNKYKTLDPTRYESIDTVVIEGSSADIGIAFHENKKRKQNKSIAIKKALLVSLGLASGLLNGRDDGMGAEEYQKELVSIGLFVVNKIANDPQLQWTKYQISLEEATRIANSVCEITTIDYSQFSRLFYTGIFFLDSKLLKYYDDGKFFLKTLLYISKTLKQGGTLLEDIQRSIIEEIEFGKSPKEVHGHVVEKLSGAAGKRKAADHKKHQRRIRALYKNISKITPSHPAYLDVIEKVAVIESIIRKHEKKEKNEATR